MQRLEVVARWTVRSLGGRTAPRARERRAARDTVMPAGVSAPQGSSAGSETVAEQAAPVAKAAPVSSTSSFDEEDDAPAATAPVEAKPTQKAEDILAMIRARQNKQ